MYKLSPLKTLINISVLLWSHITEHNFSVVSLTFFFCQWLVHWKDCRTGAWRPALLLVTHVSVLTTWYLSHAEGKRGRQISQWCCGVGLQQTIFLWIIFPVNWLIFWSIKCHKKVKNGNQSLSKPMLIIHVVFVHPRVQNQKTLYIGSEVIWQHTDQWQHMHCDQSCVHTQWVITATDGDERNLAF